MLRNVTLVAIFLMMAPSPSHAQIKPEAAIKYRQSVYTVIGWNFAPMAAMVKGERTFDQIAFSRYATNVEFASRLALEGFIPGSEKGDTKARAEIWAKMDDFKGKMTRMNEEVSKLASIAKSGSFDEIKRQFGATGASCKACHDDFKHK